MGSAGRGGASAAVAAGSRGAAPATAARPARREQLRRSLAGAALALVAGVGLVACGSTGHASPVAGSRAVAPAGAQGGDPVAGPPATAPASATVDLAGEGTAPPAVAPPVRVAIPAIGVDTSLVRLGRNADGSVEVPSAFTEAGWYDQGPAPGQTGPAVLLGHVDSVSGPAVFYRLGDLVAGDKVLVTSGRQVRTFVVTGSATFSKAAFPTDAVWGPTPDAELRLITCGGPFDYAIRHYEDNVVVFARMVGAARPLGA